MRANPLSIPRLLAALSLVLAILIVPASVGTRVASATHGDDGDKVGVCHAAGQAGTLTYTYVEVPAVEPFGAQGHFTEMGTPEAGHEQDILDITEEECLGLNEPEPSPSPSPEPDASPSPKPDASPSPSPAPICDDQQGEKACEEPEASPMPDGKTPDNQQEEPKGEEPKGEGPKGEEPKGEEPTDLPDNQQDDKDTDTDTGVSDDKQEELPTTGGAPVGGLFSLFGMATAAVAGLGLFAVRRRA